MKIKSIKLDNFAKYANVDASFDDNVTYLIGKNGSGKSTLGITAVWFMFQGIAEKSSGGNNPLIGERFRFIGNKSASAKGEMILKDEIKGIEVKVIRKLTKSGSELSFEAPEGMELDQQWLTDLFNIFLIAPKKFTELTPKEQAKAIGIDTKVYDDAIAKLKKEYTEINAVYRSFGEIEGVPEVARVDVVELQKMKDAIREKLNKQFQENKSHNKKAKEAWELLKANIDTEVNVHNSTMASLLDKIRAVTAAHDLLRENGYTGMEVSQWIESDLYSQQKPLKVAADLYPKEPTYINEMPEDAELKAIDEQILKASETNQKALIFEQTQQKLEAKQKKHEELLKNKSDQTDKEEERLNYIKKFKLPFNNLSIGEDGELLLDGKPIKEPYFSTGELLKVIPILIASQNPELKYVFLQDFNLLDDEKQIQIEEYLTEKGFQLVIEMVGKERIENQNCILLKDNVVVESYSIGEQATLI